MVGTYGMHANNQTPTNPNWNETWSLDHEIIFLMLLFQNGERMSY